MHSVICSAPVRTRRRRFALGLAGVALASGFSGRAAAQSEAETPAPNVLLLVDSSGSMEFQTGGSFPNCVPGDETIQEKSRWTTLLEVMTGTINNYSCWAQDRSSPDFRTEFSLGGQTPYDFGYVNPYHRALSNLCAYGPGVPPGVAPNTNVFLWPDKAVNTFEFLGAGLSRPPEASLASHAGCPAGFSQVEDGLLDIYKNQVRFGLMTFDARVSPGKGFIGTSADFASGMDGTWSYYPSGTKAAGHPANCTYDVDQEVGARNAAAPPWEGRMIAFGPPTLTNFAERNGWIQQTLLSTRPYGATPLNGQLYDARDFLWNDVSQDPFDTTQPFGPSTDPNWQATDCRKTIMIVLSDGEPNLDLRPYCEMDPPFPETPGKCPYKEPPRRVVELLRTAPPRPAQSVETFVVGFALGDVDPYPAGGAVPCDEMPDDACIDDRNKDFVTYPAGKAVQACCTLNEIASAGSLDADGFPRKAFFADDATELRSIFTSILNGVIRAATRTMPVFSAGGDTSNKGFKFSASFETKPVNPTDPAGLWRGQLDRHRFKCSTDLIAEPQPISKADGDDFAANVNENGGARHFYTVIADTDNRYSIRPELATDSDGLGIAGGTTVFAGQPSELAPLIPATAMQLTTSSCPGFPADQCRDRVIEHLVGVPNADTNSRCVSGACQLFGGIVHSTPTLVTGKPSDLLRDESYDAFGRLMATEKRPTVLYTSTVDGFLHAFNVAPFPGSAGAASREVKDASNNEYWSFIPPGVLPVLRAQYPNTPAVLLDGTPIIKDVVARTSGLTTRFERLAADALTGGGLWRTVLTQSFGESLVDGGYFALDITTPDREPGHAPKFLWQLTRSASGTHLFGNGGTPLITTVFLQDGTGGANEVAVAVLPGGSLDPDNNTPLLLPAIPTLDVQDGFDSTRTTGRDFTNSERARSLTIVRLDTGEVVRTFRPTALDFSASVFTATTIPAPISGQPKAFPENTGAVADRIFVGDADGRLWRVDVSSKNPAQWSMKVFFDAFYDNIAAGSQPVVLPPTISTDDDGAVTVAFATGDQQATAAPTTMVNRVASLTEKFNSATNEFEAKLNWLQSLDQGFRVTGPMQLFNKSLYYAASKPPDSTGATCSRGSAQVFAAHYLESRTANAPLSGPAKAADQSALVIDSRDPGMIFGLNLQAEPTCKSTAEVISGDDSFGYGSVSMSREVNPGKYFLTYQVSGTPTNTSSSGSASARKGITAVSLEVPRPRTPVTFESWALIYE